MKVIFKVDKEFIFVPACDICGKYETPEGGIEVARQSTMSLGGNIPMYYLCKECGKDKFDDKKNK